MAFNISPSINVYEREALTFAELNTTGKGAQAGFSQWGPSLIPVDVNSSEIEEQFGVPTEETYLSHFISKDFLRYSSKLSFVRVVGENSRNSAVKIAAPVANPDFVVVMADSTVIINPLGNDVDGQDSSLLLMSIAGEPLTGSTQTISIPKGVFEIDSDGIISFTPNENSGTFDVPYTIANILGMQSSSYIRITVATPQLRLTTQTIKRFDPTYWRVDGADSSSFSLTNYGNGFEVLFASRLKDDFVGIIWDTEDTKDHQLLAYETNYDYSNLIWAFDLELSDTMPVLNNESVAYTLTVEYLDTLGRKGIAYIALYHYSDNPGGRSAHIEINFNEVKAGFSNNVDFNVRHITKMFLGGYVSEYEKEHTNLPATIYGYVRVTNSVVSGKNANLILNSVNVDDHDVGMCTSYDDHYDLNPQRLVNNMRALGFNGFLNHYCGMSKYPEMNWDYDVNWFRIPDTLVTGESVVNQAAAQWHRKYAQALKANGLNPVFSVSWELFSQAARTEWCQTEWDGTLGRTGYEPPSYFASLSNPNVEVYLHKAYKEFGHILQETGNVVNLQIGEPWWWFNTASLMPCVYDYPTKLAFNADTGLYAPDLGDIHEALNRTGTPYDEFKLWLRNRLGTFCQNIRTVVKAEFGEQAIVCPLIFFPSIRTIEPSIATYINFPVEHYSYPNFDYVMTEAYDWLISQPPRLDLTHLTVGEIPIDEMGYPPEKIAYLTGFVPDRAIAYIYGYDHTSDYRIAIWQRMYGDIYNNQEFGVMKQFVWAYPQVMFDSITFDARFPKGFFDKLRYNSIVTDNTPYSDEVFSENPQPYEPEPILKPKDVYAELNDDYSITVHFGVEHDIPGTTFEIHVLNHTGMYSIWSGFTTDYEITISASDRISNNIENPLKVYIVPSVGDPSEILDIEASIISVPIEHALVIAGGANALGHFTDLSSEGYLYSSSIALRNKYAEIKGYDPKSIAVIQCAWGSSGADKGSDDDPTNGVNHWWNLDMDSAGNRLTEALALIDPYKDLVRDILWAQGENDAIAYRRASPSISSPERYADATNKILDSLIEYCPNVTKVTFQSLGRSYYGSGVNPPETDGIGWKAYRDAQRSLIQTRSDVVLGSWVPGSAKSSGYKVEPDGLGYIHYKPKTYHDTAIEAAIVMASSSLDRIVTPPIWVDMVPVGGITTTREPDGAITWNWNSSGYSNYIFQQFNVLDGTLLYEKQLSSTTETFSAELQRATYDGFTAGNVLYAIYGYDPTSGIVSPAEKISEAIA